MSEEQTRHDLKIYGYIVCYHEKKRAYILPGGAIVSREEASRRYLKMIDMYEVRRET